MQPAKWVQSIECGGDGCFIYTLPSPTQWQTFLLFLGHVSGGLHSQTSAIPGMYQYPRVPWAHWSSWVLWLRYHVFFKDSLTKPSKVCHFFLDLFLFILVLDFLSSHNSPLKPCFSYLLGKRGFGSCRESLGILQIHSHVGTSFQLIETCSWRFGIHDVTVNATNGSLSPTFYGKIMIQRS